jgi:hypothetical protein
LALRERWNREEKSMERVRTGYGFLWVREKN